MDNILFYAKVLYNKLRNRTNSGEEHPSLQLHFLHQLVSKGLCPHSVFL